MDKIPAHMNHGRWIAFCPACAASGVTVALMVKPGNIFVCPEEYPDTLAKTLVPNPRVKGAFNSVPDEGLREEARERAIRDGVAYEIAFPANIKEIEKILRARPASARNWDPGTTIDELKQGNIDHGVAHA